MMKRIQRSNTNDIPRSSTAMKTARKKENWGYRKRKGEGRHKNRHG